MGRQALGVGESVGIEGEQLVFDYLSRVGDLAHGTSMTAAERARLVGGLRSEIDRMRAEEGGAGSKAAVRKILDRLGKPEELVAAAAGGAAVPSPRSAAEDTGWPAGNKTWPRIPRLPQMRKPERPPEPPPTGASPPHLAGMDELGPEESDPDWWRVDPSPYGGGHGRRPGSDLVPGFVGGIEVPEVLKPPPGEGRSGAGAETSGRPTVPLPPVDPAPVEKAAGDGGPLAGGSGLGRLWRRRRTGGDAPAAPAVGGIVELAAAALLVAGAVMGSLIPLGLGWLAAWWSPRLTRNEAKWATLGMPALAAGAGLLWLWGRTREHWGDPVEQGGEAMREAMSGAWPVVLRVAAVASALFLVWRARRRPPG